MGTEPVRAVRAVVFDLFGTLVPVFPDGEARPDLPAMARELGVDCEPLGRAWSAIRGRDLGLRGEIQEDIREVLGLMGIEPDAEPLRRATEARIAFVRQTLVPRPDAVPALELLAEAGFQLALLSNASSEVPALFAETDLAPFFNPTVFSCEEHLMKPDPEIFSVALNGLGLAGSECVYVGDGYGRELTGSAAMGMRTICISVPGELHLDIPEYEGRTWTGERVAALSEIPGLLGVR